MKPRQQTPSWGIRALILTAALVVSGTFVACGKQKTKPVEDGPRVTSAVMSAGADARYGYGRTLQITIANGEQQIPFSITLSCNPSNFAASSYQTRQPIQTQAQMINGIEYVLESISLDSYCDRVGILLIATTIGYGSSSYGNNYYNNRNYNYGNGGSNYYNRNRNSGGYGGYGSGNYNQYATAQISKAFVFRKAPQFGSGQMELITYRVGGFRDVRDAMDAMGATAL